MSGKTGMVPSLKKSRLERTYELFKQVEEAQQSISLPEIVAATGYTVGTGRTYLRKKWDKFLIPTATAGCYIVKGVQNQTIQEFTALLQKRPSSFSSPSLVLQLPHALSEWLQAQAVQRDCPIQDIVLEVLEKHRQAHEWVQ
jgi:hypothetical protein